MMFKELDPVVLERDVGEHGLRKGDLGAVVHVYGPDALEVEFVRVSGDTFAVVRLSPADVRPRGQDDLPAVRDAGAAHGAV